MSILLLYNILIFMSNQMSCLSYFFTLSLSLCLIRCHVYPTSLLYPYLYVQSDVMSILLLYTILIFMSNQMSCLSYFFTLSLSLCPIRCHVYPTSLHYPYLYVQSYVISILLLYNILIFMSNQMSYLSYFFTLSLSLCPIRCHVYPTSLHYPYLYVQSDVMSILLLYTILFFISIHYVFFSKLDDISILKKLFLAE